MACALFLCGSGFSAQAAEIGVDLTNNLGAATPGKTCTLTTSGDYYTYRPNKTGQISVQTNYSGSIEQLVYTQNNNSYLMFYAYTDFYMQQPTGAYTMTEGTGWKLIFNVKADTEYIFGYTDLLSTGPIEFTISEGATDSVPATLTYCYPTAGTYFDQGLGINDITLEFDQGLESVESISLNYTDKNGNPKSAAVPAGNDGYEISGKILIIRISNTNDVYFKAHNDADYNFPFYIVAEGVVCGGGPVVSADLQEGNDYVTVNDGNISIQYEFKDGVRLVSYNFPKTFYSYWPKGDQSGMATLTFDGPVNIKPASISLMLGEHYRGSVPEGEDADPFFYPTCSLNSDATVLTIDFTGVNFTANATKPYSKVTVMINGIKGTNGLMAVMSGGTNENPIVSNTLDQIFPFVDEPYTSIQSLQENPEEITIFNLQGVKVSKDNLSKGIYIINGKKVIVK